jgi:hypothetical protein
VHRSLLALALVGLSLVAGCGGATPDVATPAPAGTPVATVPLATTPAPPPDPVTALKASFGKAFEAKTFEMTASIGSGGPSLEIIAKADLGRDLVWIFMYSGDGSEMVRSGNDLFLKQGKARWQRLDLTRISATSPLRAQLDLRSQSGVLGGVVSATRAEDRVDTNYEGVVDLAKAVEAAPPEGREAMRNAAKLASNASAVKLKAYLDNQGRLRKLSYTFETAEGDIESSVRIEKPGEPVDISVPAAGEFDEAPAELYGRL